MSWKVLESEEVFSTGIFKMKIEKCELPDGRVMPRYYVMDFPDWVNVFPVTEDGEVILLKQYRHASGQVHIEIPGGSSDPRTGESIETAARRELLEETGYEVGEIVDLGAFYPNPAILSNRMHCFVGLNCKKVAEPQLDPYEDLSVYKCSLDQVREHLEKGEIDHSIIANSIYKSLLYLDKNKT